MSRRKGAADEKLAAIDKELQAARTKIVELTAQKKAVEKEQRKAANLVVLEHVDALLVFATHTFKDCDDSKAYRNNSNCPRCALLEAKANGYIPDEVSFNVSVLMETHDE